MLSALFLGGAALFLITALVALAGAVRPSLWLRRLALGCALLGLATMGTAAGLALASGTPATLDPYRLAPGLSLSLRLDRLAAFFILTICLVGLGAGIYSWSYVEHGGTPRRRHWLLALLGLFLLGMTLVVAAANFFSLLFFWEVMSMSSFFLVLYEHEEAEARRAGLFYLVMTQLSTVCLLLGTLLYARATGTLDIAPAALPAAQATLIFLAFFLGFGTKAGLMPLHKWLPYAHAAVPSNISALMSGVMIKVAVYGLARLLLTVFAPQLSWGILLLVAGIVSAVLGVIYALKEHDLKKLLAYHSIENIGIIVLGLGLYVIFHTYQLEALATLALAGALFHTLNHALFKSLLFMTAGAVVAATGTRNIEHLGGLVRRMPATAVIFLIGAAAISALPPLNGFASEVMFFQAFLNFGSLPSPFLAVLLFTTLAGFALMSALAAACFVKAFGIVFLAVPRSPEAAHAREAPRPMLLGSGLLALVCIVLGVGSYQLQQALGLDLPVPNLLPVGAALLGVGLVTWLLVRRTRVRVDETWGCGILSQNGRMEYTASGFSEPILTIFSPLFRTRKQAARTYYDKTQVVLKEGRAEIHTLKLFEERLYLPLAHLAARVGQAVSRLQNADLDTFIFYTFLAVVLIMVVAGFWL